MSVRRQSHALFAAALAALSALPLAAQTKLMPASPQPSEARLQPGLGVSYVYLPDIRYLGDVERARGEKERKGAPLAGLDYPDTDPGDPTLTSSRATKVGAFIDGYMRFDAAGVHRLEFHSNDGLRVELGGFRVYEHDGRHPCETNGYVEVEVPEPGWYELKATYFQRLRTSCLLLRWTAPGAEAVWAPNEAFAHIPD